MDYSELAMKTAAYRRGFFERLADYALPSAANPYPDDSYEWLQWSLGRRDAGGLLKAQARVARQTQFAN